MLSVAVVLAWAVSSPAQAQPVKYAQAGMTFLQLNVGARTAAMGGTYVGNVGNVTAMFANPAGLATMEGFNVSANQTNWIADIKQYGVGAAYHLGNLGTVGVNIVSMDYGDFKETVPALDSDPAADQNRGYISMGTFRVNEYAVGLSYARQISTQFSVGGNLKYARQDLPNTEIFDELRGEPTTAENSIANWVIDFGTLYYPGFRDLRFGMSLRNFSKQNDFYNQRFELPLTFDFGVAMDLLQLMPSAAGGDRTSQLTLAADWLHPRDFGERLNVGLEYAFNDLLFLRGGYKFNYDSEGLTAGLGVNVNAGGLGLKADYAYGAAGEFFGAVHRLSLGVALH